MPLGNHPIFVSPVPGTVKLWRYMNLPKFLSLIQTQSLFIGNLEIMAKSDPFEATLPSTLFAYRDWKSLKDVPPHLIERVKAYRFGENVGDDVQLQRYKKDQERFIGELYVNIKSHYINCWHVSEYESSAMWDIYSRRNEGVAIQSSEARIKDAIKDADELIYGGMVSYADYMDDDFNYELKNVYRSITLKRQSFSYEREYRLVHTSSEVTHKEHVIEDREIQKEKGEHWAGKPGTIESIPRSSEEIEALKVAPGIHIKCDLEKLIEEIYVSPLAPDWFHEIVGDVAKKYGVTARTTKSSLGAQPLR